MIEKLNPAVPRHFLFALAGALWTLAGALLCSRSVVWLLGFETRTIVLVETAGASAAAAGYFFLFSRIVRRNIDRIGGLPDRASIFAFTPLRGYLLIGIMMTAGIALRSSSLPLWYLSLPYAAMGGVLLTGSLVFYREFLSARKLLRARV